MAATEVDPAEAVPVEPVGDTGPANPFARAELTGPANPFTRAATRTAPRPPAPPVVRPAPVETLDPLHLDEPATWPHESWPDASRTIFARMKSAFEGRSPIKRAGNAVEVPRCISCKGPGMTGLAVATSGAYGDCTPKPDEDGRTPAGCTDDQIYTALLGEQAWAAKRLERDADAFWDDESVVDDWSTLTDQGTNDPIVDGVLFTDSLVWLIGEPGTGKSLTALHLAACLVTGMDFLGHAIPKPLSVAYVAAERAKTVAPRLAAWQAHYGRTVNIEYGGDGPRLHIIQGRIEPGSDRWQKFIAYCVHNGIGLVVLDTQSAFTGERNEDTTSGMAPFVRAVSDLKDATGGTVLTLHHPPRGTGKKNPRGSGSIDGAADSIMFLGHGGGGRRLESTKQNLAEHFTPLVMTLKPVDGSVILAHKINGTDLERTKRDLKGSDKTLLDAWWNKFGTAEIELRELVALGALPKTTTWNACKSLVTKGLASNTATEPAKLYRLVTVS